jgi:hypothetical protein
MRDSSKRRARRATTRTGLIQFLGTINFTTHAPLPGRHQPHPGIEPAVKRQCQQCGAVIPKWRAGKKVPSTKQFCSPKCRDRAWRAKA